MNHCNEDIHNEFLQNGFINCEFCNLQLQEYKPKKCKFCFDDEKLNNENVCINCGASHEQYINEYINFHENKYKIHKKSIYFRKYHINNV